MAQVVADQGWTQEQILYLHGKRAQMFACVRSKKSVVVSIIGTPLSVPDALLTLLHSFATGDVVRSRYLHLRAARWPKPCASG